MNINDVKELKTHYETALVERMAKVLNISADAIRADWSLERTIITVNVVNQSNITTFAFEYNGTELFVHSACRQVMEQNGAVMGIAIGTATITLNTIHAIFDTIIEVLNSAINEDDCDKETRSEADA